MRHILTVVCLALAVAACADVSEFQAPPTTATSASTAPTPADATPTSEDLTSAEGAFLEAMGYKAEADGTITYDPSELEAGRAVCGHQGESSEEDSTFGGFVGPPTVDDILGELGMEDLMAAAITHLCPKYLPILRKAQGGFTDGTYEVGKDIKPGTYKTTGPASDCYWERSTGGGDTIANDFITNAPRGVKVTVRKGEGFKSENCGNWIRA